jgi:phage portal protein BeeE
MRSLTQGWPWQHETLPERTDMPGLSLDAYMNLLQSFSFQGLNYSYPANTQEEIGWEFASLANSAYKSNGVVFACVLSRVQLFSEARFLYRRMRSSRPGDLFGFKDDDLGILRSPWEGGTTGDLLTAMLMYADLGGNAYVVRRQGRLTPLRPDWTTIIAGLPGDDEATVWHPDARVLGYAYQEGGSQLGKDPVFFLADEVAHFAPNRDPLSRFRGMSWLTPIVREVMADKAMTEHKLKFHENAGTPNLVVSLEIPDLKTVSDWAAAFRDQHEGAMNAYKTLFLGSGADVTVVGKDLAQLDFKVVQGAGETRIAAAAGVPPIVAGLSEGLEAATYSNYAQARRRFADNTIRPLWRNVCGSLANIIKVPSDAELWYDDRDIMALQDDMKDRADIQVAKATASKLLLDAGYDADSVTAAIQADDFALLKHSGLFSVQLQPPGTQAPPEQQPSSDTPAENGTPPQRDVRELLMSLARR